MTDWNESSLKAAASWKAYKEGKSLLDLGYVADARSTPDGWTGSVRAGKRLIRLGVKVPKAGHFEVKCSCPENRASGAVCAHAVATGLALLTGIKPTPVSNTSTPSVVGAIVGPVTPLTIRLAPNWLEGLSRGRLTVTVSPESGATVDPADAQIAAWLASQGVMAVKSPLPLALDGPRLGAFLIASVDHPRAFAGKYPLALASDATHPLAPPVREGDFVILSSPIRPLSLAGDFFLAETGTLSRLGHAAPPADLAAAFADWSAGRSWRVSLRQLLRRAPIWEDWIAIPEDSWLGDLRMAAATPAFHLELDGSLNQLTARASVRYDDSPVLTLGDDEDTWFPRSTSEGKWLVRHLHAETEALAKLAALGFTAAPAGQGGYVLSGEPSILRFFAHGIPELGKTWTIEQSARLQRTADTIEIVRPKFEVIGSGGDWLAFDYCFETNVGASIPRAEVLQWLRSGRSSRTCNGKKQILDEEAVQLLEPLIAELNIRQEKGHFVGSKAIGELILEFSKNKGKPNSLSNLNRTLPSTLEASVPKLLRPYQMSGIGWLIDRVERFGGALLADDMGLGKTLQTIAAIEHLFASSSTNAPALVIGPTSLLGNWRAEFQRFAPGRTVRILHGTNRDSERSKIGDEDVIVTSFGTLARDLAWHLQREYRAIAVDEASLMRNPDTDHAKAIAKLRSPARIALSGTPVENGVRDLWSIFRFVQPGWLGTREEFKERYETPLQSAPLPKGPLERLRLKTAPFILRRTKEEVATDLPAKLIIDDYCDLSADQRQVYRDILSEGGKRVDEVRKSAGTGAARLQLLTTLLRLRQTCCDLALLKNDRLEQLPIEKRSSKLERLLERVDKAISGNHRMLVFSQFQTQLQKIKQKLEERGIEPLLLDGQTRNRQELVDRFQKPDGPPVFLISLKAGGYGLNLTAADTVVHFDPWWNPAAEAQATDRAYRIGQSRPVTVYRLLTRGTVEEKVVRLQATKRELAQATFNEDSLGEATNWTDGDLSDLLKP